MAGIKFNETINSVALTINLPDSGDFVNQIAYVQSGSGTYYKWNGSAWVKAIDVFLVEAQINVRKAEDPLVFTDIEALGFDMEQPVYLKFINIVDITPNESILIQVASANFQVEDFIQTGWIGTDPGATAQIRPFISFIPTDLDTLNNADSYRLTFIIDNSVGLNVAKQAKIYQYRRVFKEP